MPMDFDDRHIGFRGLNETMLQQFSDVADIGAAFNQVAGETATQSAEKPPRRPLPVRQPVALPHGSSNTSNPEGESACWPGQYSVGMSAGTPTPSACTV
jgi:hypothetical protein